MDKLRVAVVGCGLVAQNRHLPGFLRLKEKVEVQAVCDINRELATSVSQRFCIPRAYSDLGEMLSHEGLDVVTICTPPHTHASLATQAMEKDCHVLLEKPMALTMSDCDRMIEASSKHRVKLTVAHNSIFQPAFLKFKSLAESGLVGDLVGVRIYFCTPPNDMLSHQDHWAHKLPGGLIGETGPHIVYISLAFLNKVTNIDVFAKKLLSYPWAPFDEFRIILEGERLISSVIISYANTSHAADVDLFGTKGVLHLDLQSRLMIRDMRRELTPADVLVSSGSVMYQIGAGIVSNAVKMVLGLDRPGRGHEVLIERFVDSVLTDQRPPVTAEEGRETIRVMELIVQKLKEKYAGCVEQSG